MTLPPQHERSLDTLRRTVAEAADYLSQVDEALFDGYQTAREVLSHLVFWHREYLSVAEALVRGRDPSLKRGTFASLNASASAEFRSRSLPSLAEELTRLQVRLETTLRQLPDWEAEFPVKAGGGFVGVAARIQGIEAHIRNHLARLRRAAAGSKPHRARRLDDD